MRARLRELQFGRLHFAEDAAAAFQEQAAFRRQRDGTGRAVKQPHAKALFQPRHCLADGRRRHAELPSGNREAAGFRRLNEDVERAEALHGDRHDAGHHSPKLSELKPVFPDRPACHLRGQNNV